MRKLLTGASVLMAAAMMAPVASADSSNVGIHSATIEADSGGDGDFYGLDGGWNHAFSGGWAIQADGQIERLDAGGVDLGTSYGAVGVGLRNESYSVYGFAGLTDLIASGTILGIGGQLYFGNFVVNASYANSSFDDPVDLDVDGFDVSGAYFFTPNLGVTVEVGTAEFDAGGGSADLETYGVGVQYRIDGSPVALSARYRHDDVDVDEYDTWLLGVSLNFGTETAHEQATQGASWNGARNAFEDLVIGGF